MGGIAPANQLRLSFTGSEDGEAETETCRAAKPLWRTTTRTSGPRALNLLNRPMRTRMSDGVAGEDQALAQTAGRVGRGRHGGALRAARGVSCDLCRGWLGDACAGVQLQMVFAAGGAVALASILIAEACKLVAAADAVAVAGFRSSLNWNQRHCSQSLRFHATRSKSVAS